MLHEYDLYLQLFNYYKDEDLDQLDQSQRQMIEQSKKKFPTIQEALAASFKNKIGQEADLLKNLMQKNIQATGSGGLQSQIQGAKGGFTDPSLSAANIKINNDFTKQ